VNARALNVCAIGEFTAILHKAQCSINICPYTHQCSERLITKVAKTSFSTHPEFLERDDCLDGVVGQQVVEHGERAEGVRDALKHPRVQSLYDVPLQVQRSQRVQVLERPGLHSPLAGKVHNHYAGLKLEPSLL
jgi:hypothetical protein